MLAANLEDLQGLYDRLQVSGAALSTTINKIKLESGSLNRLRRIEE